MSDKVIALLTKHAGRIPVDGGSIEVIMREPASYVVSRGWSYRFKSKGEWLLLALDEVAGVVFGSEPAGSADASGQAQRSAPTPQEQYERAREQEYLRLLGSGRAG